MRIFIKLAIEIDTCKAGYGNCHINIAIAWKEKGSLMSVNTL